jgi:acetyl-CoA carboxylase carboxyltransferase component
MENKSKGKAVERIYALLDERSFVEIGQAVTARSTDFQLDKVETPSDGVVTGYGLINGCPVYVYSQDAQVLGGSIGEMHARKIVNLYDLAIKTGVPVIGMIDCAGIRLQESTDALHAFGMIYKKQAEASGVILQISAIFGNCGGGLSVFTTLTDFTLMEEKGQLFVNAPNAIEGNRKEVLNSASAVFQSKEAGTVDFVGNETEVFEEIRKLTQIFPSNYKDQSKVIDCVDDLNRLCENISAGNGKEILIQIADQNEFVELKKDYGNDMAIGFIRLNGETIGCIANKEERISAQGAKKAASFVKLCDAFGIGILTVTDTVGFVAEIEQEKELSQAIGAMTGAFVQATVPKVNVISKKAFGSAYVSMNSKSIGADFVYAWNDAKIGMMEADMAVKIMNPGANADVLKEKAQEYEELQSDVFTAARRGYVDTVIDPAETRKYVIGAFEMLYTKREMQIPKKHSVF